MSPHHSHWKSWLAPAGVMLVSVWGLYHGAVSVFVRGDDVEGESRSTLRSGSPSEKFRTTALKASMVRDVGELESRTSEEVEAGSKLSVSDRVKSYQAARRAVGLSAIEKAMNEPIYRRTTPAISRGDTQSMLRAQIMSEAYKIAIHSNKPWQNLVSISSEYYRRGDGASAREVLLTAEKLAVDPDSMEGTSIAVSDVVKAMLTQRHNDDAMAALQNIRRMAEREKAMAEVAVWAARDGRLNIARNLVGQIGSADNRDIALVAIAESQASYEGMATALKTAGNISSVKRQNDAYRRIALKRAALKDFSEAEQAVVYINDGKLRDSALSSVARQRARSGDLTGGLKSLLSVNDPSVVDSSLRTLSGELARSGWFSSSAYVTTRIRDNREKSFALESLSVELAKSGDISGSLVRTGTIPLSHVRERALRNVSTVTAWRGAPDRARNVAFRIGSNRERDLAYRGIAQAAARNGNYVAAFNTLQDIDFAGDKALAMVSLARARQNEGNDRKALALLEGAGRTARELSSIKDLDAIRANMAVAYAERSESDRSLHLVAKMKNSALRDKAYQNLARTHAINHDIYSAQKSVVSISSEKLRHTAEDNVARVLARYVTPQQAIRSSRTLMSGRQKIIFLLEVARKT